jgi:hypothetical protein
MDWKVIPIDPFSVSVIPRITWKSRGTNHGSQLLFRGFVGQVGLDNEDNEEDDEEDDDDDEEEEENDEEDDDDAEEENDSQAGPNKKRKSQGKQSAPAPTEEIHEPTDPRKKYELAMIDFEGDDSIFWITAKRSKNYVDFDRKGENPFSTTRRIFQKHAEEIRKKLLAIRRGSSEPVNDEELNSLFDQLLWT